MRFRIAVVFLAGLVASSIFAAPTSTGKIGSWRYMYPSCWGRCVGFYPDGSLFMAGDAVNGPPMMEDVIVARIPSPYTTPSWWYSYDLGNSNVPYSVAMVGDIAYLVGGKGISVGPFLSRINPDGIRPWTVNPFYSPTYEGVGHGVAIDPADGTIWVAGYGGGAPQSAILVHYRDDGTTATELGRYTYLWQGYQSVNAYCLAVTRDSIYMAGTSDDMAMAWRPWIIRVNRSDPSQVPFSARITVPNSRAAFTALASSQGRLFGLLVRDTGPAMAMTGSVVRIDEQSGGYSASVDVFTGSSPSDMLDYSTGLAAHPSLPLLVAGGAGTIRGVTLDLTATWAIDGIAPGAMTTSIQGVAIGGGLDFQVGAAYHTWEASDFANAAVWGFTSDVSKAAGKSHIVVAPNVFELGGAAPGVNFVLRSGLKAGDAVTVKVYDAVGNLVWSKEAVRDSTGGGNIFWDGVMTSGNRVGPGIYTAILTGAGAAGVDRMPFVVRGKPK